MKLIYLANTTIPSVAANSVQIMKMCEAFSENGCEVILFLPSYKNKKSVIDEELYKTYGVRSCFKIEKIFVPDIKGRTTLYLLRALLRAKKYGTDLTYTRFIKGGYLSSLMGIPVVYESHDLPKRESKLSLEFWLFKSKRLKKIVTISHALKDALEEKFKLSGKIFYVAPDGATPFDDVLTEQPLKNNENKSKLQIGYVGSLHKGKGIEIISQLSAICPHSHFHIIGGSSEDVEYWKSIVGKTENITFYGHIEHKKTTQYLSSFDVLLAPYQEKVSVHGGKGDTGRWMSPLKIFEYMSSGNPIIASDLPVLREVLKDNDNSLLCDPNNINEWVKAIDKLKDKDLRARLGNSAKKEFLNRFTWNKRAEGILKSIDL